MTITAPRLRDWLPRLLKRQPHQIIGGTDYPYLLRWYVIPRNPVFNVYLHKFLRSDDDRALHDHPWWFVSLILRGRYDEITEERTRRRNTGSIAFRPAEWRHRVQLLDGHTVVNGRTLLNPLPCWTLIITGRRSRLWGFWCRRLVEVRNPVGYDADLDRIVESTDGLVEVERFVPWQEFGDAGCGEVS